MAQPSPRWKRVCSKLETAPRQVSTPAIDSRASRNARKLCTALRQLRGATRTDAELLEAHHGVEMAVARELVGGRVDGRGRSAAPWRRWASARATRSTSCTPRSAAQARVAHASAACSASSSAIRVSTAATTVSVQRRAARAASSTGSPGCSCSDHPRAPLSPRRRGRHGRCRYLRRLTRFRPAVGGTAEPCRQADNGDRQQDQAWESPAGGPSRRGRYAEHCVNPLARPRRGYRRCRTSAWPRHSGQMRRGRGRRTRSRAGRARRGR